MLITLLQGKAKEVLGGASYKQVQDIYNVVRSEMSLRNS